MRKVLASLIGLALAVPAMAAQDTKTVPPGTPVQITVTPAAAPAPPVSIILRGRHGHVTPERIGHTHTGSGYIDVAQPTPDVVVITMVGVAVAYPGCHCASAAFDFDLDQCFEVSFDKPDLKKAKISLEGRVIGLLRSECGCCGKKCCGGAEESHGCATILCTGHDHATDLLSLCVPDHSVACGESLALNDHEGPCETPIVAGKYTLREVWRIQAHADKCCLPCKASSAEFAPDPALDPLWISYWEPFHGVAKKDFGFQITVKVAEDTSNGDEKKEEEKKPEEKKPEEKKPL
jgi:hypothetical protein